MYSKAEPRDFGKLIARLPNNLDVLDVGSFGVHGDNTTHKLIDRYGIDRYTGITIRPDRANLFEKDYPDGNIIVGDFYEYEFDKKYDVLVMDMNIENNLKDWSNDGLKRLGSYVKPGGFILTYIMLTTEYGLSGVTPQLIKNHRDQWWGSFDLEDIGERLSSLEGLDVYSIEREETRPYILWVALKKQN